VKKPFAYLLVNVIDVKTFYVFIIVTFYVVHVFFIFRTFYTARCYASAILAVGLCPSVCVCVCLSVTSQSSTKMAKRRITQITPHDTTGTLVF